MPEIRVETGAQKGQVFLLRPPGPYLVGRELAGDFPLFDRRASRRHFQIDFCDEGYRITDLGSKAGIIVDDSRVKTALLRPGARIIVGKTILSFHHDPPEDPLLGRELGGYRVLERVGRGGMGIVYRALQVSLDRIVALKVLSDELSRDQDFSILFVREARAAGELSHPHIVRVYDVNILDGVLFYAMEYMAHGSVEDLCRRTGRLSVRQALRVAIDAARGLDFAQREGVVHRDIKPSNLMIHENGTVKIGDLGIATHLSGHEAPRGRGISGSPHYMSPEQILGRDVDARADIYSLGASLHQMLAGAPPFRGDSLKEILVAHVQQQPPDLRALRPDTPAPLADFVRTLLAKQPAERPSSGALLAERLEEILAATPEPPRRAPRPSRRRWIERAAFLASVGAAALLGGVLGTVVRHVRVELSDRDWTLNHVRRMLKAGREAIEASDLVAARAWAEELLSIQLPSDEREILQGEIESFLHALRAAAGAGKESRADEKRPARQEPGP